MRSTSTANSPAWLRWLGIILGASFFVWFPFEDTSEQFAILFAAATCTWLAARLLARFSPDLYHHTGIHLFRCSSIGLLAGLGITPVAVFLMAFKTGLHGHGFPDFTSDQIFTVLHRTPFYITSGLLIGFGAGLWRLAQAH